MASVESVLQILIKATDQSGSVLSGVGSRISSLATGAKDVSQPFADLATAVGKLDVALAAMAGGGLALAITESGKFSGSFAEITTLFDAAPADISKFRDQILDYAKTSKASIEDINAAVYAAISAGSDYADSLSLVSTAEQTAIAGKAGLQDATVLLASSLNAYNAKVSDATKYSDALFVAVRDGQTTLPELASSLAQVTGVAAQSGVSFDELLAAVATLTASGLPTSQAVTAIKGALTNILKPSKDAVDVSEKLGIQFTAAGLASKGLGGFMADLTKKAGGNIDAMSSLFGSVEGLNGALILTGTGAGKFADVLDDMQNKAGATATAYKKMADEFDQINQTLANSVKTDLIAIGDVVKDDYTGLVKALAQVFNSLGDAVKAGAFDDLFQVIEDAFNTAETALESIAKNLPNALGGVDLTGLANAFGGMFDGIDISSVQGLRTAIQTVVDSLESLVTFSRGLVSALTPFVGLIAEAVDWFNGLDDGTKKAIAGLTGVMTVVNLVSGPVNTFGKAIGAIGSALDGADGLGEKLENLKTKGLNFSSSWGGKLGVAAVITASATAVVLATKEFLAWRDAQGEADAAAKRAADSAKALEEKYKAISEQVGITIRSSQDLRDAVADQKIHFDEATKSWQAGAAPLREVGDAADKAASATIDWSERMKDAPVVVDEATAAARAQAEAVKEQIQALTDYYIQAGNAPEVARFMAEAEASKQTAIQKTNDTMDEAKKKTESFQLKMEELASNERLKSMQFNFELNTKSLEIEGEKAKKIIDNLGIAIQTSSDLLSGLFDNLLNTNDFGDKWLIEQQIDKQNDRLDEQFKLEKKLVEQQIKMNDARLKKLQSGDDSLIKVELDPAINPAIESVLKEFVKYLQVWVSESAEDYLLLSGGGA